MHEDYPTTSPTPSSRSRSGAATPASDRESSPSSSDSSNRSRSSLTEGGSGSNSSSANLTPPSSTSSTPPTQDGQKKASATTEQPLQSGTSSGDDSDSKISPTRQHLASSSHSSPLLSSTADNAPLPTAPEIPNAKAAHDLFETDEYGAFHPPGVPDSSGRIDPTPLFVSVKARSLHDTRAIQSQVQRSMRTHAALNRRSEQTMQPQHEETLRTRLAHSNPTDFDTYQEEGEEPLTMEEEKEKHKDDNEGHLGVEGQTLTEWNIDELIRIGRLQGSESLLDAVIAYNNAHFGRSHPVPPSLSSLSNASTSESTVNSSRSSFSFPDDPPTTPIATKKIKPAAAPATLVAEKPLPIAVKAPRSLLLSSSIQSILASYKSSRSSAQNAIAPAVGDPGSQ